MYPSDEHLASCGCVGHNVILWLYVDSELSVLEGNIHIVGYLLLLLDAKAHIVVIIFKIVHKVPFAVLCRKGGSVKHYGHGDIFLPGDIYAKAGDNIVGVGKALQSVHASHNKMLNALLVREGNADTEDVRLYPSKSAADKIGGVYTQMLCDIAQKGIALFHSKEGIDKAEIVYVKPDDRKALVRVLCNKLFGLRVEFVLIEYICKWVKLRHVFQLFIGGELAALNGVIYPEFKHLGSDRLFDKVPGSEGKGFYLAVCAVSGGGDNNRDLVELLIHPHSAEHLIAAHYRHIKIQKDARHALGVFAESFQRLFAVFGFDHVI